MDMELAGKTALVAGGSKGLGKAIALELAREGVDVAIGARTREELDATAREIHDLTGRRIVPLVADVTSKEQVDAMIAGAVQALGSLHILINSAATPGGSPGGRGPIAGIDDDTVLRDFDIKFMGAVRCSRAAAPHMKQAGWGRIITLSGHNGRNSGNISAGARNVSLVHLTKTLADELGSYGITANVIHPGPTRTERTPAVLAERAGQEGISIKEAEQRMAAGTVIGRVIDASEIAYLTVFLASPKAGAITGEVIEASGGASGRAVRY